VPEFRLFFVGDGGAIERTVEFVASGDQAALVFVANQQDGRRMEVWCQNRLVRRIPKASSSQTRKLYGLEP